MPSGSRRRKVARKKKHKRVAHNSSNTNSDSISSTHSQESDDVKSVDERESDCGEAVRDAKGRAVGEDESRSSKGEGPEEETVEVESDSMLQEGNLMAGSDSSGVDMAKKAQNGDDSMPRNGGSEEKEIAVEPEEIPEIAQSVQDSGSIYREGFKDETTDPAEYLSEETVGAKGAVAVQDYNLLGEQVPLTEAIKEVVTSPQEFYLAPQTAVSQGSAISELVETDLKSVPPLSDEKENSPAAAFESHLKKIETLAVPVEDDTLNKTFSNEKENADKFSEYPSVPAVIASGGVEAAITPAIETTRDVECVKNGETVKHTDDHVGASVVETSNGVDNGEDFGYSKHSENQPLIGSTSIPVQRTSWTSCCGLFEVCSRSR